MNGGGPVRRYVREVVEVNLSALGSQAIGSERTRRLEQEGT